MRDQQIVEQPNTKPQEQWLSVQPGLQPDRVPIPPPQPRRSKLALISISIVLLLVVLLALGYLPRRERERELAAALQQEKTTIPKVNAALAKGTPSSSDLLLPSNVTPITEAVINARADGYLRAPLRRYRRSR